jgi:hypothetical protein
VLASSLLPLEEEEEEDDRRPRRGALRPKPRTQLHVLYGDLIGTSARRLLTIISKQRMVALLSDVAIVDDSSNGCFSFFVMFWLAAGSSFPIPLTRGTRDVSGFISTSTPFAVQYSAELMLLINPIR